MSTPELMARFKVQHDGAPRPTFYRRRIVLWDADEGGAFIGDGGSICWVRDHEAFIGYEERDRQVGCVPALAGTVAVMESGERLPVVAWLIDEDGEGKALIMTGDGVSADVLGVATFDWPQ